MKVKFTSTSASQEPLQRAFTLIEMIGVLAVIAILAVIIVPNMLHQLDTVTGQQEAATLQGFSSALQSSICRNFYIPGTNDWASNIAAEIGMDTNDVITNSRSQQRVFLIDPNFWSNSASLLSYTQTTNGLSALPFSPRLMILSSIGTPLPTNVTSGVPAVTNDFGVIWNTADGTPPTNATGFSSWTAVNGNDLKVQRINLSPLFVQLVLSTYASATNGLYVINPSISAVTNSAPYTNGVTAYYIQNSVLRLINNTTPSATTDSDQILNQNSSFVYNLSVWRNSISNAGAGSVFIDFNSIVAGFLSAPLNSSSGVTQTNVVQDMINYLNAYDAWAAGGFGSTGFYSAATTAQTTMTNDIYSLINGL